MTLLRESSRNEWAVKHDIPLSCRGCPHLVQEVVGMRREEVSRALVKKEELSKGYQGLSGEGKDVYKQVVVG